MEMEVESAKRRFKIDMLKAEARRDDELFRIDEEQELLEEDSDVDCLSFTEKVNKWVDTTIPKEGERVSDGNRRDERNQTDTLTESKQTDGPTFNRPENGVNSVPNGGNTVSPNPGIVGKPAILPSPCPPEDVQKTSNFFNVKPFFTRNASGGASQNATHKVTPSENQIPEELKDFFKSDTADGEGPNGQTKESAISTTKQENSTQHNVLDTPNKMPTATPNPAKEFTSTPHTTPYTTPYTAPHTTPYTTPYGEKSAFDRM